MNMKTKYTSKAAAKPSWNNAILLGIAALALLASPGVALADCTPVTNWTGAVDHNWFTSGNWSGGVPNSGTGAVVNNAGTAQISGSLPAANACSLTLDPGNVSVSNQGSLTITQYGIVVGDTSATGTSLLAVTDSAAVTAATSVVVNGSGTLTGNGTVSTTSGTTIYGTLVPSSGRLTISTGDLTFSGIAGPLMESKVVPASADNVYVSAGTASLSGRLSVSMSGTFTPGTRYTLLHAANGLLNGSTFSSVSITYPTGQGFTPKIIYAANDVYLCLVPDTGGTCD